MPSRLREFGEGLPHSYHQFFVTVVLLSLSSFLSSPSRLVGSASDSGSVMAAVAGAGSSGLSMHFEASGLSQHTSDGLMLII